MKLQKWIFSPMAVAVGLIPQNTPVVLAQNSAVPTNGAVPINSTVPINKPAPPISRANAGSAQPLPSVFVWNSQAISAANVGPWGNGSAQTTNGRTGKTLLVTIRNFDEGARFDLTKPVDITPYRQTGFWRIKVQTNGASQRGGSGRRGRGRNQTPADAKSGATPPLTQLRLKFVLDYGVMSGLIPINQANQANRGRGGNQWQNLLLPVRNMSSTSGAHGLVRRIILTGDSEASFSLDQLALVAETNRITANVRRASDPSGTDLKTMTLKPGRSTTLMADVEGGTSDLNVEWNFNADNSAAFPPPASGQGIAGIPGSAKGATGAVQRRIDAIGLSVRPNWPNEEQDYRVEVTITDKARKKPTVKKSILVQVRGGI